MPRLSRSSRTLLAPRFGIAAVALACLAGCHTCLDVELRDAATLAPIGDARVMATPWSLPRPDNPLPVEGLTDAQGRVTLDRIGSTSFIELRIHAPDHPALTINVQPPLPTRHDQWTKLRTLQGEPAAIEARISECDR